MLLFLTLVSWFHPKHMLYWLALLTILSASLGSLNIQRTDSPALSKYFFHVYPSANPKSTFKCLAQKNNPQAY